MLSSRVGGSSDGPKPDVSEQWKTFENGLDQIDAWYLRNGGKGPYLLGEVPSWADIVVASFLAFCRIIFGEDSNEWKEITTRNGGQWKNRNDIYRVWETAA